MKEFKQYKISVKLDHSDQPCASVYCELCHKPYKLVPKKPQLTMMLSNWTSHIKACVEQHINKDAKDAEEQKPKPKQQYLLKYGIISAKMQKSQSSTSSQASLNEEGNSAVRSDNIMISEDKSKVEAKVCCTPSNSSKYTVESSSTDEESAGDSANIKPQDFCKAPLAVVDQEGQPISSQRKLKVYSDWSYAVRQSKLHLKFVPNQYLLTSYCPIVDKISKAIEDFTPPPPNDKSSSSLLPECFSTVLFRELLYSANENCKRVPQARRHTEIVKKFSLSVLLRIGSSGYELLHKNMPEALPSLSTVKREAAKRYAPLIEGEFHSINLLLI